MSISVGLLVIAFGAILRFAVTRSPSALDLHVVGVVLMIMGAAGLLLRLAGYGPDSGLVVLPRWVRRRTRSGIVEERLYDPMAEDATVYRPAEGTAPEQATVTSREGDEPVARHQRRQRDD